MHVNKNCMVNLMTHALVNFSPWLRIYSWLELRGQKDGKLCSLGEGEADGKDWPVCACMCDSVHDCGCVVNGSNAMVAS